MSIFKNCFSRQLKWLRFSLQVLIQLLYRLCCVFGSVRKDCMHWYSSLSSFMCYSVPNLGLGGDLSVFKAFDMLSRVRLIHEQLRVFI